MAKIELHAKDPSPGDLQEYITWVLTQDVSKNPLTDLTGERASRNQGRKKLWFIPGGIHNEKTIVRKCTVPANTEIFIPAATADSSHLEHEEAQNDDDTLLAIANEVAKLHKNVQIRISRDGGTPQTFQVEEAKNPKKGDLRLIEKPAFPLIFPEENVYKILYGVKGGYTHLAVVGWAIKVKLEPGEYTLTLEAEHDAADIKVKVKGLPERLQLHAPRFYTNIKCTLTAIPEKEPLHPFNDYPE